MQSIQPRTAPAQRHPDRPRDPRDAAAARAAEHDGRLHLVGVADRPHLQRPAPAAGRRPEGGRPTPERAADLFTRGETMTPCPQSTVLFAYFAQWFTDGFLRTDRTSRATRAGTAPTTRSTCSQLYGLTPAATAALRAFDGGRLKSQLINGEEFPPYLARTARSKPEFAALDASSGFDELTAAQRDTLFATGQRPGQLAARLHACSTCSSCASTTGSRGVLAPALPGLGRRAAVPDGAQHPHRAADQARDRGVHQPHHAVPLPVHPGPAAVADADRAPWHRQNWASVEFNLLYRWHSLIPSAPVGGRRRPADGADPARRLADPRARPRPRCSRTPRASGPAASACSTPTRCCGRSTWPASPSRARSSLAPYNDYREHCRFPRVRAFEQISGDRGSAGALRELYRRRRRPRPVRRACSPRSPDAPNAVLPPLLDQDHRHRRLLAGADQPAAGAAGVQRRDLLPARHADHRDHPHALGRAAPQHRRRIRSPASSA